MMERYQPDFRMAEMVEDVEGEYVEYADAQAALAAKDQELTAARNAALKEGIQSGELRQQLTAKDAALEYAIAAIQDAITLDDGLDGATGEACCRILVEARERGTFDQAKKEDLDILTATMRRDVDTIETLQQELAQVKHEAEQLIGALRLEGSTLRDSLLKAHKQRDTLLGDLVWAAELAKSWTGEEDEQLRLQAILARPDVRERQERHGKETHHGS